MEKVHAKLDPPRTVFDSIINRLTGRVGKVTALIVAIGGLTVAILTQTGNALTQAERAKEKFVKLFGPSTCVVVAPAKFPPTVKLSEWDKVRVTLSGQNNCPGELGLYVTFSRNQSRNSSLFAITSRHADLAKCDNYLVAETEPRCWNPKKPVVIGKGPWTYAVLLPKIDRLTDWQSGQEIIVDWTLRDYDNPTNSAFATDTATIEVDNDLAALGK